MDSAGFAMPAEWSRHRACWLAWPADEEVWEVPLEPVRREFRGFCHAIAARGEALELLVRDEQGAREAAEALEGLNVRFHRIPYGDVWLRDTGPLFLLDRCGELGAARFRFNGWGGRYLYPHDEAVAEHIVERNGCRSFCFPFVLEGGAVDVDGQGSCLAAGSCLLAPSRNPAMSRGQMESGLREALGVETVLWLSGMLAGDHTDGHVDTLARFVAPGVVLCMEARGRDDPNRAVLEAVAASLAGLRDVEGRKIELRRLPSPGLVLDDGGLPLPASYLNFYIANEAVVVPVFGSAYDCQAVDAITDCFVEREIVALPARSLLAGGGTFHCITQQEPQAKQTSG